MSATQTATVYAPEKTFQTLMQDREVELVRMKISLEEFAQRVKVNYDDRFHSYRVTGDPSLYYWLHDVRPDKTEFIDDATAIALAYEHLREIQARNGQVNTHSVYVEGCEEIFLSEKRKYDYASVTVVRDRVDGKWRFATSYQIYNGGGGYAPSIRRKKYASKNEAIFGGADELLKSITRLSEYRDKHADYQATVNRIIESVEKIKDTIRQPSLFGF